MCQLAPVFLVKVTRPYFLMRPQAFRKNLVDDESMVQHTLSVVMHRMKFDFYLELPSVHEVDDFT